MLKITLITIGKTKNKNLLTLADEYLKRLRPYAVIKTEELKAESFSEEIREKAKRKEGERIMSFLDKQKNSQVFLLAEKGHELDSLEFANKLFSIKENIIFVIAGALGFNNEIFEKYNKISLSRLTFTHEMAKVVLLEQVYRAITIKNNKNYHY